MNLYTFFEKNFEDKDILPAVSVTEVIDTLNRYSADLSKSTETELGMGFFYKSFEVDGPSFLADDARTYRIKVFLNRIVAHGIVEGIITDQPSEENITKLKKAVDDFIKALNKRQFKDGFICNNDGNLDPNNEFLKRYYSEKVIEFLNKESGTAAQEGGSQQGSGSSGTGFVDFLRSLQLLEHSIKNYTRLYMESSNRAVRTLLEGAFTEQQISEIFSKEENLKKLLDLGSPEQINYIMYKVIKDLPGSEVSGNIEKIISNNNASEGSFINLVNLGMRMQGISLEDEQLKKLYQAVTLPPPTSIPQGLETFGKPGGVGTYVSPGGGSSTPPPATPSPATSQSQPSAQDDAHAAKPGVDPTDKELEIYRRVYNANYDPDSPRDRANLEQIRKNAYSTGGDVENNVQAYRAQSRRKSLKPIENRFIRTGFNQFRPAVQADIEMGAPLFMPNPNPVYKEFNPYVQVDRYEAKRNKQPKPDSSKNRVNPNGARIEADGSIRRKSKLGGAAGSFSNFLGDVGNTLKGR